MQCYWIRFKRFSRCFRHRLTLTLQLIVNLVVPFITLIGAFLLPVIIGLFIGLLIFAALIGPFPLWMDSVVLVGVSAKELLYSLKGSILSILPSVINGLTWKELRLLALPIVLAFATLGIIQNWFKNAWNECINRFKYFRHNWLRYRIEYCRRRHFRKCFKNYFEPSSTTKLYRKALEYSWRNIRHTLCASYNIMRVLLLFIVAVVLAYKDESVPPPSDRPCPPVVVPETVRSVVGFPVFFGNASGNNGKINEDSPGVKLQLGQKKDLEEMARLLMELIDSERKQIPELLVVGYASTTPIIICKDCDKKDSQQQKSFTQDVKINRVAANHRAKQVAEFLQCKFGSKIRINIKTWKDYTSLESCIPYQRKKLPSSPLDDSILKRMNQSVMIYAMPGTNGDNGATNNDCFSGVRQIFGTAAQAATACRSQ